MPKDLLGGPVRKKTPRLTVESFFFRHPSSILLGIHLIPLISILTIDKFPQKTQNITMSEKTAMLNKTSSNYALNGVLSKVRDFNGY